jgi:CRP-like cAMP-binding protein
MVHEGLVPITPGVAERATLIDETRWANDMTWQEIEALATYMHAYTAHAGTVIFAEGERDAGLWLVAKGRVDVVKHDSRGQRKTLAEVGPGRTLGEMSLVDGEPASASAVAASDCVLLLLTRKGFQDMLYRPPNLGVKLLLKIARLMSQRLRQTSGTLVDLLERT